MRHPGVVTHNDRLWEEEKAKFRSEPATVPEGGKTDSKQTRWRPKNFQTDGPRVAGWGESSMKSRTPQTIPQDGEQGRTAYNIILTLVNNLPVNWATSSQQESVELSSSHPTVQQDKKDHKHKTKHPAFKKTPAQKPVPESLVAQLWANLPARSQPHQNLQPEVGEKIPEGWTIGKPIPTDWRRQSEKIPEGWTAGKSIPTGWRRQSSMPTDRHIRIATLYPPRAPNKMIPPPKEPSNIITMASEDNRVVDVVSPTCHMVSPVAFMSSKQECMKVYDIGPEEHTVSLGKMATPPDNQLVSLKRVD